MKRAYDKTPSIQVPGGDGCAVAGWDAIAARLQCAIAKRAAAKTVIVVECYPGVDETEVTRQLDRRLQNSLLLRSADAFLPEARINSLAEPFLGADDPVFGFLCGLVLPQFFDPVLVGRLRSSAEQASESVVLIVGCGARVIHPGDILVYADLARWEGQLRFRRNEASNLGVKNCAAPASQQYKRAFFVDWRVCDRWKRALITAWDFLLDTNNAQEPKLAEGEAVRRALRHAVTRPFRVVPFFDPAPWGGTMDEGSV